MQQELTYLQKEFQLAQGSLMLTDQRSVILYGNQAVTHKRGLALAQMVGQKPGNLWGGEMDRSFYQYFWDILLNQQKAFVGSINNKDKEGNNFWEDVYIAPICNKEQTVQYFFELKPNFYNHKKDFFTEEFRMFWDNHYKHDIFSLGKLLSWLQPDSTKINQVQKNLFILAEQGFNIIEIIEHIFITPTQELFLNRNEDELLIHAAQKEPEAFVELYLKYYDAIYYYFLKRVQGVDNAHDFTQETFLKAFKTINKFKTINASYYTYLKRVSHNLLLNHYRKKQALICNSEILETLKTENISHYLEYTFFWRAVESLPEHYRDIFIKKYRQGMRIKEIAQQYNKSENAIKLILTRGRKILKKKFK